VGSWFQPVGEKLEPLTHTKSHEQSKNTKKQLFVDSASKLKYKLSH